MFLLNVGIHLRCSIVPERSNHQGEKLNPTPPVRVKVHQSFHLEETTQQLRQDTRRYFVYHLRSVHFLCSGYILNWLMINDYLIF
jgi:hypothetical protein